MHDVHTTTCLTICPELIEACNRYGTRRPRNFALDI